MAKTKETVDSVSLLKDLEAEQDRLFAEFEAKMKEQREKKLAAILEPLRKERQTLCTTVNDANTRISEIDKELAKLTGEKTKAAKATGGGRRTRLTGEALENHKKAIAAMGGKLYGVLKKKGKGEKVPVAELSAISLGLPVKGCLQPYIDAGLVGFHANGPKPLYSFEKDGEPK